MMSALQGLARSSSRAPDPAHTGVMVRADPIVQRASRRVRQAALAVAVADLSAVLCLALFAIIGEPLGTINDVANAAVGMLSALLAWQLWLIAPSSRYGRFGLMCAALGAAAMTTGSVLVIFDVTGWFLAGLVSAVGAALIGLWLLAANGVGSLPAEQPGVARLGMVTGGVLLVGLAGRPSRSGRHRRLGGGSLVRQPRPGELAGHLRALPDLVPSGRRPPLRSRLTRPNSSRVTRRCSGGTPSEATAGGATSSLT